MWGADIWRRDQLQKSPAYKAWEQFQALYLVIPEYPARRINTVDDAGEVDEGAGGEVDVRGTKDFRACNFI